MKSIATDYLIIGAGASGMAFADVLASETAATMVIVDRYHQPGGHWNRAYPFVRLHQPSSFYGVNSRELGSGRIDGTGWNRGLYELASASEISTYFNQVMQQHLLPSGRVQYFPLCEYCSDGTVRSVLSGSRLRVTARRIVDTTYLGAEVPSMRPPEYEVAPGVASEPLNVLPFVRGQYKRYAVVGAGKTGIDACLFLLANSVQPDRITWIMPRDSWFLNRAVVQPGPKFALLVFRAFAARLETMAEAASVRDLLNRTAGDRRILRLDRDVWPTMYHGATMTEAELEQLRRIRNVVRLGRVKRIERDAVILDQGDVPTFYDTLHVDCTASGGRRRPLTRVFDGNMIKIQFVRSIQPTFSAAFIAHVEAAYRDSARKNQLCVPVAVPDLPIHYLQEGLGDLLNSAEWAKEADLQTWLRGSRLDPFSGADYEPHALGQEFMASIDRIKEATPHAVQNLECLLSEEGETTGSTPAVRPAAG